MKHQIIIHGLEELQEAAQTFLQEIGQNRLIAFFAPMGAGKTTFTTAICHELGVSQDAVSSPTFAILNEYRAANGAPVFHFDFYRINKPSEALDLGLYDYLDSGNLCLMEWPENIEELLPEETVKVMIQVGKDGARTISWED